jgi:hypothetical protein
MRNSDSDTRVMRIVYLPANDAWALVLGDSLIEIENRRLFSNREDLIYELRVHGLKVVHGGRVVIERR